MTEATPKIWRDMDQATLDRAYDQAAWCPDIPAALARYAADTAAARAALRPETLSYGPDLLDLYPARGDRRGTWMHVHGGAWRHTTRADAGIMAPALTALGYDVAVPDFSQLPDAPMTRMVDDLLACTAFLRARSGAPLHLSGHSSGAHLAAVLTTREDFASATLISGMYDLEPVLLSARSAYVTLTPDEAHALSPLHHAARISTPLRLAWGTRESPEFIRQSEAMADATNAARFPLPDTDHFAAIYALTNGALRSDIIGKPSDWLRERRSSPRPFKDSDTDNLRHKLASGALQPQIAEQIRAELEHRGESDRAGPHSAAPM